MLKEVQLKGKMGDRDFIGMQIGTKESAQRIGASQPGR
jgi:hypothetical protein